MRLVVDVKGYPDVVAENSEITIFCDDDKAVCAAGGQYISRKGKLHEFTVVGPLKEVAKWLLENVYISFTNTKIDEKIINTIINNIDDLTNYEIEILLRKLFRNIRFIVLTELLRKKFARKITLMEKALLKIVWRYGTSLNLKSGSTNLYDDYVNCTEEFNENNIEFEAIWSNSKHKVALGEGSKDYEYLYIIKNNNEIIGLMYEYEHYYISGFESGGYRYIKVLPFKPIKVTLECSGRFCRPAEIGYRQDWRVWSEEKIIQPPSEKVVNATKYLLSKYLELKEKLKL